MASNEKWNTLSRALHVDSRKERPRPVSVPPRPDHPLWAESRQQADHLGGKTLDEAMAIVSAGVESVKAHERSADHKAGRCRCGTLEERRARKAERAATRRRATSLIAVLGIDGAAVHALSLAGRSRATAALQPERYYARHGIVARHEAGHAVAANALGILVDSVSVTEQNGLRQDGVTRMALDGDDERALMVMYAGWRAERSHPAWDDALERLWEDQPDAQYVDARIAELRLPPSEEQAMRNFVIHEVDELLLAREDTVDALADALLRDGTVSGRQLADLLDGKA